MGKWPEAPSDSGRERKKYEWLAVIGPPLPAIVCLVALLGEKEENLLAWIAKTTNNKQKHPSITSPP